jgi:molecular chaperone GrpE
MTDDNVSKNSKEIEELKSQLDEKTTEIKEINKEMEEKDKIIEDYRSQNLRLQADFENYKKRSENDLKEYIKYANENLILKIVEVYEDLERALKVEKSTDLKGGVDMIYNKLKDILQGEGLETIKSKGENFDPFKHEALMVEHHDDYDEGIVIEELGKGYTLDSKVIKYSKVKVCKKR